VQLGHSIASAVLAASVIVGAATSNCRNCARAFFRETPFFVGLISMRNFAADSCRLAGLLWGCVNCCHTIALLCVFVIMLCCVARWLSVSCHMRGGSSGCIASTAARFCNPGCIILWRTRRLVLRLLDLLLRLRLVQFLCLRLLLLQPAKSWPCCRVDDVFAQRLSCDLLERMYGLLRRPAAQALQQVILLGQENLRLDGVHEPLWPHDWRRVSATKPSTCSTTA